MAISLSRRMQHFVAELRAELGKVTYPTRQEATRTTIIVTVIMVCFAVFLGLVDNMFRQVLLALFS